LAFHFVDRILELNSNQSITIRRYLSSTEQYLEDHFPKFPVMPGVLILESAVQAASWLLHHMEGFEFTYYSLTEATNVKFGQFVKPGDILEVKVDLIGEEGGNKKFKALASLNGKSALRVQFKLKGNSIRNIDQSSEYLDRGIRDQFKKRFEIIAKEAVLN
jgi:3-hydroxyacyl-[acyl-carrier-protein] dehydratase